MYTSGSTGRPKGVAVVHRAIVRLVRETGYLDFGPREVWLQLAPFSFDAATLEIWGALLHGGRLVALPGGIPGLAELGLALARYQVSCLWLTAGLFHQMVDADLAALAPVRQLLAGGDVLLPERVRAVLAAHPGSLLVNGYGPTENTTFTCCQPMRGGAPIGASVAIGRPIANTRVLLVDRSARQVPIGVPGELLAGGDGLARGYHARPAATAERFVPDPVGGGAGRRVYRTGDLARRLADGRMEFLGRLDRQVKIRGFRVEPAEIEALLAEHPAVRQAAVVASGEGEEKVLAAYVVLRGGGGERGGEPGAGADAPGGGAGEEDGGRRREPGAAAGELRAALRARLPAYMVPASIIELPELPLTRNGKVDRAALPAPTAGEASPAARVAPRSPLEAQLAAIWRQVLDAEAVGVHDNFFEIGGHSLKATRVVARIRQDLAVELPLQALFEAPTIAELSAQVVQAMAGELAAESLAELLEEAESLEAAHPESLGPMAERPLFP
jgi:acyl-coenzyme A synthetase/AMP-(fatty) acid ligase/acyl carrier protein